jgi:hypothetical protein
MHGYDGRTDTGTFAIAINGTWHINLCQSKINLHFLMLSVFGLKLYNDASYDMGHKILSCSCIECCW